MWADIHPKKPQKIDLKFTPKKIDYKKNDIPIQSNICPYIELYMI